MKKKAIRMTACMAVAALLTSLFPSFGVRAAEERDMLKDMRLVAENDSLALYFDEEEAGVAVCKKDTGDVWFSNPPEAEKDEIASEYYKRQMKSQIFVRYFNNNVQEASMDSYSDAVKDGQFEVAYADDGLTVTYSMGDHAEALALPDVISAERFDQFMANLDEKTVKRVNRYYMFMTLEGMRDSEKKENLETYPGLEKHDIYYLRTNTKDYLKEELAEYFAQAGYTKEDQVFDNEDNGFEKEDLKPWFTISLTYKLEGENLVAQVDPEQIEYNDESFYLVDVELLPYFGAAGTEEEGYIFVPDGSGALIRLNNGSAPATYSSMVYGQDQTMNTMASQKSEIDSALTVKMPVYGLKTGNKAWMAVIEDGDGYADISASASGGVTSYNSVYAGFQYLLYGNSSLDSMVGSNSFQLYSRREFSGDYKIRFSFLSGDGADYSGMAEKYRAYLQDRGVLATERTDSSQIPFYAEYIGAINKYTSFLGVKYQTIYPTTTYAQAGEITDKLLAGGVENLSVIYSGWAKGGLHGEAFTKVKDESKVAKGGVSRREFQEDMASKGVDVFLTADFQYVYKDAFLGDGYSSMAHAPRYFDNSKVKSFEYLMDTRAVDKSSVINLISPVYVEKVSSALSKSASKLAGAGLNMGSICYNLYTDQAEEDYADRQAALKFNEAAGKAMAETFEGRVMADNANAYMLGGVSDLINAPMDSNRSQIIDDVVPFYEMVLHGYVDYAGDCLNLTDDYRSTLLKSAETGAGIYFKWIYCDNSVLKETDFDSFYSVNYNSWMDTAIADYARLNQDLGALQKEVIAKHEIIADNVVRVTYEKGTQIIVNYSREDVEVDNTTVKARDYAVVKGHE